MLADGQVIFIVKVADYVSFRFVPIPSEGKRGEIQDSSVDKVVFPNITRSI